VLRGAVERVARKEQIMGEHLYRRGKTWWGWTYDASGEQDRFSTHCTDKTAARILLAQKEREAQDPDTTRRKAATLEDAIDLLVADRTSLVKAGKRSLATVSFYETCARSWFLFAGRKVKSIAEDKLDKALTTEEREDLIELGKRLALVDAADERFVDAFILYRRANGVTENTIAKDRTTFRAALRLAKRARIWTGDLDLLFPRGFDTDYEPNRSFLTRGQGSALLDAFLTVPRGDGENNVGPQTHRRAFLAFILATGADLGDVVRARPEDIGRELVRVRGTKTVNRERLVPIVTSWQRDLLKYVKKHADGQHGLLFSPWTNARRGIALACDRAGVPHVSPKRLRHTFAHWMLGEGVRTSELYVAMGHADTRMLDRVYGKAEGAELHQAMVGSIAERRAALRLIRGGKANRASGGV
jgi:integrase